MFDSQSLNRLYRYCFSLCNQESDAFDLLQDAVERVLRSAPDDPAAGIAFAMRLAQNLYIDRYRRSQVIAFEQFDDAAPVFDYDLEVLDNVVLDRVELDRIWPTLSFQEREILYLWALEGYTTEEVAELLEKPRGTILSIIHRMRKRLNESTLRSRDAG